MNQSRTIIIFTDAATSPQTGIAVGAFLYFDAEHIKIYEKCTREELTAKLSDLIIYREYASKKSTWSEIKTVINALNYVRSNSEPNCKIELYTDCQSLCDLMGKRKERLIKNNFITKAGIVLQNADLYKELFEIAELFQIQVFKMKGHSSIAVRLTLKEKIFAVLDHCSRRKLRSQLYHQ